MRQDDLLVAGLGNPGKKYADTRHNIGFRVIDELAERLEMPLSRKKFEVVHQARIWQEKKILLAKPMAYMNNSGPPLASLARYYKIKSRQMIIIHDDIDLAFGKIKIKTKGGHGGHKGIESIIDAFGEPDFTRVRIGVGHPGIKSAVVGHVLGKFSPDETAALDHLLQDAGDAVTIIIQENEHEAMRRFHGT